MSRFTYANAVLLWFTGLMLIPDSGIERLPLWVQWVGVTVLLIASWISNDMAKNNYNKFLNEVKNNDTTRDA